MRIPFFVIAIFFFSSCKTSEKHQPSLLQLSDSQKIAFLDSTNAAAAIVKDTIENYFDQVNKLDMSIQLKRKSEPSMDRDELLKEYKTALQKDVRNFTAEEISFIKSIFKDIFKDCSGLSENIFPSEIKLIKIQGTFYGSGAFYTRENCIIIPQAELKDQSDQSFRETMLHELFHIYSRFNLQKKAALYNLIGFKSTGGTQFLQINQALKERIILNPDGINYAYSIKLMDSTKTSFNAIPIIISNENNYSEAKKEFFDYLEFGLYKINPPFSRLIKVDSKSNGESFIDLKNHPEFFEQITDNTDYIIHPDELMADNFVIAVQSFDDPAVLANLSEPGKALIEKVIEVLRD